MHFPRLEDGSAELSELHTGQIFFCLAYILFLSGSMKEKARSSARSIDGLLAILVLTCSFFLS